MAPVCRSRPHAMYHSDLDWSTFYAEVDDAAVQRPQQDPSGVTSVVLCRASPASDAVVQAAATLYGIHPVFLKAM